MKIYVTYQSLYNFHTVNVFGIYKSKRELIDHAAQDMAELMGEMLGSDGSFIIQQFDMTEREYDQFINMVGCHEHTYGFSMELIKFLKTSFRNDKSNILYENHDLFSEIDEWDDRDYNGKFVSYDGDDYLEYAEYLLQGVL